MTITFLLAAALAPSPQILTADGPWHLATEDSGCTIERDYGGSSHISFGIEADIAGDPWLFVVGPHKRLPNGIGETPITIQPSGAAVTVHYGSFDTRDDGIRLVRLFPDKKAMDDIEGASSIAVGKSEQQLALDGLQSAVGAVRQCTANLLSSWGADPNRYLTGKLAKLGNLGKWLGPGDYPSGATKGGKVVVLIQFGVDGKPTDCHAVVSPDEALSNATCRIAMQHATATMPLDDSGNPIASYTISLVNWTRP